MKMNTAIPAIQAIRRRYDRRFDRWMPHINLLYGFVPEEYFEEAAQAMAQALAQLQPFEVRYRVHLGEGSKGEYQYCSVKEGCPLRGAGEAGEAGEEMTGLSQIANRSFERLDEVEEVLIKRCRQIID
jgi:hypothetical protein